MPPKKCNFGPRTRRVEAKRRKRANQTEEERASANERARQKMAQIRAEETAERRAARLEDVRLRARRSRFAASMQRRRRNKLYRTFQSSVTAEGQVPNNMDSPLLASIKMEQPEVYVEYPDEDESLEYPDQDEKTFTCSQNISSLPMQEHSQMEMMMLYGNMDSVKQELSDELCEDKNQLLAALVDVAGCSSDQEMTGQNDTVSRVTEKSDSAFLKHKNCSQISENESSNIGITELSLTKELSLRK